VTELNGSGEEHTIHDVGYRYVNWLTGYGLERDEATGLYHFAEGFCGGPDRTSQPPQPEPEAEL